VTRFSRRGRAGRAGGGAWGRWLEEIPRRASQLRGEAAPLWPGDGSFGDTSLECCTGRRPAALDRGSGCAIEMRRRRKACGLGMASWT